jgi:hypothetical protein
MVYNFTDYCKMGIAPVKGEVLNVGPVFLPWDPPTITGFDSKVVMLHLTENWVFNREELLSALRLHPNVQRIGLFPSVCHAIPLIMTQLPSINQFYLMSTWQESRDLALYRHMLRMMSQFFQTYPQVDFILYHTLLFDPNALA